MSVWKEEEEEEGENENAIRMDAEILVKIYLPEEYLQHARKKERLNP